MVIVLVAVLSILAWAMYRGENSIVTHALTSIAGLLAGYGIGRYRAAKQADE